MPLLFSRISMHTRLYGARISVFTFIFCGKLAALLHACIYVILFTRFDDLII